MQAIKSAGRALSKQRAEKIAEMFRAIANLLIETGAADVSSLKGILDQMVFEEMVQGESPDSAPIQASSAQIPFKVETLKTARIKTALGYKKGITFRGVLARIDEVSEGIPAIGTGQPLFLPLFSAEKIVEQVQASPGMFPIDADISLSKHADENIIGVITNAGIEGQDLVVSGHLFADNVPSQINQIIRSRRPLGMSMNAMVSGYQTEMDDRPVFYLQNVDLIGANVLFADKATYQRTRFTPVAASNQNIVKEDIMDPLEEKLARLEQMLSASQENFTTQLAASQAENLALKSRLEAIEAEKHQQELDRKLQLAAAAKEAEITALEERIANKVGASLEALVSKAINPRRQVQSLISTTPLVQVAAQAEETNPLLAEIEQIDSRLQVLRATNSCGTVGAIALAEKKRNLQMQLAQGVV